MEKQDYGWHRKKRNCGIAHGEAGLRLTQKEAELWHDAGRAVSVRHVIFCRQWGHSGVLPFDEMRHKNRRKYNDGTG